MKKVLIGIDFSKEKFDVAIIVKSTSTQEHALFDNKVSGYRKMIKWINSVVEDIPCSSWLFCGETTGGYSRMMSDWLYAQGYDVWIENALVIKRTFPLKRLKNDTVDAFMIAEYALRFEDRAQLYEPMSQALTELREIFLYRHHLVRHRCSFEVRRIEKRFTQQKSANKNVISQSARHIITEINKEIAKCDEKIKEYIESDDQLSSIFAIVTSMPGVGTINAVSLMVYTNNFTKFAYNPRKIACYYGIAPFGRDSGTSVHTDPRVGFIANKMLKSLLTQAALASVRTCPQIAKYYQRLIERGKKPMVALNNVKNKMIAIITAMVRTGCMYQPDNICLATQSVNVK